MNKTERICYGTIIIWKNSRKVFATVNKDGSINRDPLAIRSAQIRADQHFREIAEYNRFQDEWDRRPTNADLYGRNCYRPDEVALTDEEYERWG